MVKHEKCRKKRVSLEIKFSVLFVMKCVSLFLYVKSDGFQICAEANDNK